MKWINVCLIIHITHFGQLVVICCYCQIKILVNRDDDCRTYIHNLINSTINNACMHCMDSSDGTSHHYAVLYLSWTSIMASYQAQCPPVPHSHQKVKWRHIITVLLHQMKITMPTCIPILIQQFCFISCI